jgi:hypothetical protein
MRKKNIDIIKSWSGNQPASSYNGNLRTDGKDLWSYNLKIGTTVGMSKILADYTAKSNKFLSQTTSCHVNKASPYADVKVHPTFFTQSDLDKIRG